MKSTKKSLLLSVLSLVLCFAMLLGTTYAWFTDSVTSGRNTITAGNLDVELYHSSTGIPTEDAGSKVDGATNLFPVSLWEPGVIAYENFTVKNVGNLALKFDMNLGIFDCNYVKVDNTWHNLADVIKVATVDSGAFDGNRAAAQALDYVSLADFELSQTAGLQPGQSKNFALVLYWEPSDNDNIYNLNNGKQSTHDGSTWTNDALFLELGVHLTATQLPHESDSFDNTYDDAASGSVIAPSWSGEATANMTATGATLTYADNNITYAKVTVPAGAKADGSALAVDDSLKLTVKPSTTPGGVKVETGNSVTTYDVSLVKVVSTTESGETTTKVTTAEGETPVTVELNIGVVDLQSFSHNGVALTKVDNVTQKGQYSYNQSTGIVTFMTDSFSPFSAVYKFAGGLGTEEHPYLIANGEQWYSLIKDYNDSYIDSIHVKLIGDLDMENYDLNGYVTYPKNFSLDGNGHKFTSLNSTIWGYYGYYYGTCEIKDLTVENSYAKYSLFGYGPGKPYEEQTVNVSNVTVKNCEANGGTFMYYTAAGHINFTNCVVENSLVHGPSNMGGGGFVGNGQGITINNCKFGGSVVAESTNMVAGFVGQGKATIKNSEITSGTVIRSIAAGGNVAAYDGQGGGAGAEDHNAFNGTLSCDIEANANKQNSNATWVKYEGLKVSEFQLAEDGTITFVGENRNFSSATISESIFQRSDYYRNGNSGQSDTSAYLLGGYSCYWEDLIHVDSITSNTLYKVDRVKNIVNVVSEEYAGKIACATATVPDVAWTRYDSYLDRETGTLYYDGRYSTDDYCGFIGDSATVTADGTMTPKTNPKGNFNIVIKCFDENGGLVGSVTLQYTVNFTSNPA